MSPDLPRSPLPHDEAYWEALARRVRRDAEGPLTAYAAAHEGWSGVLARRARWLVAAAAAAMLVLWLALPQRGGSPGLRWMVDAVVPRDVAGTLVSGARPPSVEQLLVQFAPPADEEGRR